MSVRKGGIIIAGTPKVEIVDDLNSASPDAALSANQGKLLKESIDEIKSIQDNLVFTTEDDILELFNTKEMI